MIFAADLNDILLTGQSATITFEIQKGGTVILRERYSPDNDQCIRIGGLAKIANTCLYGSLGSSSQASCHATFSFSHGMSSEDIYACLRRVNRTPSAVLSLADESTMVAGHPHLLTLLQSCNYTVMNGSTQLSSGSFSASGPTTVDVQSKYNAQATHMVIGGEHTVWFDHGSYADALCVRFLNVFDVPQSVVFRLGATLKPSFTADDGVAYGFARRYAVEAKDDITLKSGALQCKGEYAAFYDLVQTRRAQLLTPSGNWVDVLPDKSNYTQKLTTVDYDDVSMSFKVANAMDSIL